MVLKKYLESGLCPVLVFLNFYDIKSGKRFPGFFTESPQPVPGGRTGFRN